MPDLDLRRSHCAALAPQGSEVGDQRRSEGYENSHLPDHCFAVPGRIARKRLGRLAGRTRGLREPELAEPVASVLLERMPFGRRPGSQVDRRLAVGGEHDEPLAGRDPRHRPLRHGQREGACEPARIHGRHNRIVNSQPYSLAAVLAADRVERLYSGLSVIVSTAADGQRTAALASFGALELLLDPDLARHAQEAEASPALAWGGRETFGRSLGELRDAALELETLDVYACAASVETMPVSSGEVEELLTGVMSTPRFLRETAGARLIFV